MRWWAPRPAVQRQGLLLCALAGAVVFAQAPRIVLRWRDVAGANAYELQIARDASFLEVVLQTRTTAAGYRWDQLPSATHWWRVRSFDADGRPSEWSQPRTVSVDSVVPEVQRPTEAAVLPCGTPVELELVASLLIKEYVVELASNPSFQDAREFRRPTPVVLVGALASGAWFVRAKALDFKGQLVGPGPTRAFFVRAGAPRLKPLAALAVGAPATQLTWSDVACAKGWLVEMTSDAKEKVSLTPREATLTFKPTQAGEFRWRVAAVDDSGSAGDWSAEAAFRVRLPTPTATTERVATHAELSWEGVPTAVSYRVELSNARAASKGPLVSSVPTLGWRTDELAPGRYTWRVQARDARGHASDFSAPRSFEVRGPPALATPVLTPVDDAAPGEPVTFSWVAVAGAAHYEVTLDASAPTVVVAPGFTAPPLPEGWHSVQVRARDGVTRESDLSSPVELYVGVAPVSAAQVAVEGERLRVQLYDKRGRSVGSRVAPRFAVRHGTLGPPQLQDETWSMAWKGSQRPDVLTVRERAFEQDLPLEPVAGRWFWVAVGGGGIFNGGAVASGSGSLGLGYRLPWFSRRAGVELRAGVFSAGASLMGAGLPFKAVAWVFPVSVLVGWQQPLGAFVLRGGAGPSLHLAAVEVNEARQTTALPAFELAVALGRALGPGQVQVEVGFSYARLDSGLARLAAGGFAVRVGYSLDFGPR